MSSKPPRSVAPAGRVVACPSCRQPASFAPTNRWRPFCSERCKTGDLGAWATNAYVIEGAAPEEAADPLGDDNAANYPTPTHPPGRA